MAMSAPGVRFRGQKGEAGDGKHRRRRGLRGRVDGVAGMGGIQTQRAVVGVDSAGAEVRQEAPAGEIELEVVGQQRGE